MSRRPALAPAAVTAALALAALAALAPAARAHTMSDGRVDLVAEGDRLVGTIDVAVRDLHDLLGLDSDGDLRITAAEVAGHAPAIAAYVAAHLAITTPDGACTLALGDHGVVDRADGAHVALALVATCPGRVTRATVDYRLLYELDAQHRGLVRAGDGRGIARQGASAVAVVVRSGTLARAGAAMPGGPLALAGAGAVLALALAVLVLRRTTRHSLVAVAGLAAAFAAPVAWALHRLVA
jgi:hypothetical protein